MPFVCIVRLQNSEIFAFRPDHYDVSFSGVTLNPNTQNISNFQLILETELHIASCVEHHLREVQLSFLSFFCMAEY